ncbi:PepSY domain-containing protein [Shewanella sp. WXL01]|uniref:PepSY-associated TM helix domain-containing protein n=1 Tax=Shewanella sp. WXL01 TaxID=2709721 RepID=UPI0014383A86|nr:PepSY-associated TM helix domain-containing protein [Shewanella sp. WXL01]NKF49070.1 PepSY domain-containing protein [Shewanella sp. WXL01]
MKIRPDVLRTYQSVHTWTGITTSLLLFIAFFAGALTMFKPQIDQWARPASLIAQPVSNERIDTLIEQAVTTHEKASQGFIVNFVEGGAALSWFEQGGGRELVRLNDELTYATLDDADKLQISGAQTNELGDLIDQLHRTAGIIGKVGHEDLGVLVLGIAAALYFIALISGVIVLLPTLVKYLFALRQNKGANRFWLDSHNLVGVVSLPFHLLIAWTAVVFAFHDPFYGGLGVVYGDKPLFERGGKGTQTYDIAELPSMAAYKQYLQQMAPDYKLEKLEFSQLHTPNPTVAAYLAADDRPLRGGYHDIIYFHPFTQAVGFSTVNLPEHGVYGPVVKSFFALHFGNYAGDYGRWMYFAMGLLGAFLFYSGNLLWLEKRREKKGEQRKSVKVMAALTIGVCLGAMLGIGSAMVASKWLYLLNLPLNHAYLWVYYSVFFAAIGYSFYRGAARSAIHLLYALFAVCVAIPVTSLLALVVPGMPTWTVAQSGLMVEFMAVLFALVFMVTANKAKYRAYYGERNSIWALPRKNELESNDFQQVTA